MNRALRALRHVDRLPEMGSCVRHSAQWPELTAAYLGLAPVPYPYEFRTRKGDVLVLENFHDLVTAWVIFFRPEYRVDPHARVIVDAGANIGAFSVYAARRALSARIVAIEPYPDTMARLRDTVGRNGLGARVHCRPWALGASDGVRKLALSVPAPSQSRGVLPPSAEGATVECVSLATLFDREHIDRVDLFKMDIEGDEHDVLRSAPSNVLRRISTLAMEYHPNGSKPALLAALAAGGFELTHDHPMGENYGVAMFRQRQS